MTMIMITATKRLTTTRQDSAGKRSFLKTRELPTRGVHCDRYDTIREIRKRAKTERRETVRARAKSTGKCVGGAKQ